MYGTRRRYIKTRHAWVCVCVCGGRDDDDDEHCYYDCCRKAGALNTMPPTRNVCGYRRRIISYTEGEKRKRRGGVEWNKWHSAGREHGIRWLRRHYWRAMAVGTGSVSDFNFEKPVLHKTQNCTRTRTQTYTQTHTRASGRYTVHATSIGLSTSLLVSARYKVTRLLYVYYIRQSVFLLLLL